MIHIDVRWILWITRLTTTTDRDQCTNQTSTRKDESWGSRIWPPYKPCRPSLEIIIPSPGLFICHPRPLGEGWGNSHIDPNCLMIDSTRIELAILHANSSGAVSWKRRRLFSQRDQTCTNNRCLPQESPLAAHDSGKSSCRSPLRGSGSWFYVQTADGKSMFSLHTIHSDATSGGGNEKLESSTGCRRYSRILALPANANL